MFFIFGINQKREQVKYDQVVVCDNCGHYGHLTVWVTYSYLMLFFIPVFNWGHRYFVQMGCCGAYCEIDKALGERIAAGKVTGIDPADLPFREVMEKRNRCPLCGYSTEEDFQFCPKCGTKMIEKNQDKA